MSKKIPKASKGKNTSIISPPIVKSDSDKIVFSFDTLERTPYFNLDGTCANWSSDLFDMMKIVSSITKQDLISGKYRTYRVHNHEKANPPNDFPPGVSKNDCYTSKQTAGKLDTEISFDSYIVGTNDKSVFIVDKKNKKEYELVPHKQKMRTVSSSNKGIIYNNGEEETISMDKLINTKYHFEDKNNYIFTLDNKTLYMSIRDSNLKTKITNNKVDQIIKVSKDNVYYLIGTTIYRYNLKYGETKIIQYSELEYNNTNLIFIK